MDSHSNSNNRSQRKAPPAHFRHDNDEDKTDSPSSFTARSETNKTRNTSSGALKNGQSNRSSNTIGNMESADRNAKKQARAAAARAASSGRYLKPPPLSSTPTGTASSASARVISDAQAKSRGRRPNNSSSVRYQPRRAIPSAFQSSPFAFQSPDGLGNSVVGTNITKLQRLQEEVAAKARSKPPNTNAASIQRRPNVLPSSMNPNSSSSVGTSIAAVKRLNNMESDIAAKNRTRASRGNGIKMRPQTTSTTMTTTAGRLNQMEADLAAKARGRAGRASYSHKKDRQRNGDGSENSARVQALNKKLAKASAARSTSAVFSGAVPSTKNAIGAKAVVAEPNKKSMFKGMNDSDFVAQSSEKTSAKEMSNRYGEISPYIVGGDKMSTGMNEDIAYENQMKDDSNGLAVAVAVNEDDEENVFIPSAVQYDPDAKLPIHEKHRFRVYSLLGCALLIIVTACSIGTVTVLKKNKYEIDSIPSMAPTCSRCTSEFDEQLVLEVGAEKLKDPTSPEYMAKQWIIHEDEMELDPTAKNFIQRFWMATFYFDTHRLSDWRSCNRQSPDPLLNETERCELSRVSNIEPLTFYGYESNRWLSNLHECQWAGIWCDEEEIVRVIDIHGQGIQGTLPTSLAGLPYLDTISLQWNKFDGTLPDEFANLQHLIHFELHNNQLTGSFPPSWARIRNIQLLNLSDNRLRGQLPVELGNFRNIKGLYLFKNSFSGTLPPELSNTKSLAFARFHKNKFEGTIPSEYGDMQLVELWLHGNRNLTGTIPTELGKLSDHLTDLRLSGTNLEGTIPEFLFELSDLWRLEMHNCFFTGTISSNISRLGQLKKLKLNNNVFTGKIPDGLASLNNLVELDLSMNFLSGSIPSRVCENEGDAISPSCLPGTDPFEEMACECCFNC